jgi:hypothetical protein
MPIDTRAVSTSTTVTATEACPYCRTSDRIRRTSDTSDTSRVQAWACDRCNTDWAFSVIRPDSRAAALLGDLGATAQEIGWLRWVLRQVVMLADNAPGLTDEQLRNRLSGLADRVR